MIITYMSRCPTFFLIPPERVTELYMRMLKWNIFQHSLSLFLLIIVALSIFLSLSPCMSLCMHKQTQYFNCSEQVIRRLWNFFLPLRKDCHIRVPFSFSVSFSLYNQTKEEEERLIFLPNRKCHNGTSQFFPLT